MNNKLKVVFSDKTLRNRILFTVLILILFRLGCMIPVPFINATAIAALFNTGNIMTYLDMLSGGSLSNGTFFALGIAPYINATIIVELLCVFVPHFTKLKQQSDGAEYLEKWNKSLGLVLSVLMALGYYFLLRKYNAISYFTGFSGFFAAFTMIMVFLAGSEAVMWLSTLIDEKGIGSGASLLILAGIVSRWSSFHALFEYIKSGKAGYVVPAILAIVFVLASVFYIVYMSGSEQRVPIVYANSYGAKGGNSTSYFPLRLIAGGVMPVIFANTILAVPATILMFINQVNHPEAYKVLSRFCNGDWVYCVLYAVLIFAFNYFYLSIQFDPTEAANSLRRSNASIPGVRPGRDTSQYLLKQMHKLAATGSITLIIIAVIPIIISQIASGINISFGGTSLLIVIATIMEILFSIDSYLAANTKIGFISKNSNSKKSKIKNKTKHSKKKIKTTTSEVETAQ